jgi:hypothetical protein
MVDEPKPDQFIGQIPGNLAGADNEVTTVLILAPDSTSYTPARLRTYRSPHRPAGSSIRSAHRSEKGDRK